MNHPQILPLAAFCGLVAVQSAQAALISVDGYVYGTNPESQPQPTNFQSGAISDVGNVKLIDGNLSTGGWSDGTNVGFRNDTDNGNPQPQITFDLGDQYSVATIDAWGNADFLENSESMTIASSVDGVTFSTALNVAAPIFQTGGFTNGNLRLESVDVSSLPSGQFYRLEFFDPGQWMMINEVEFDGTLVPEPSAAALLALGGLALLRRRRAH